MTTPFLAGQVLRSNATFVPEAGTVLLVNVTATAIDAAGLEIPLTPEDGAVANQFKATFTVPDAAISGPWVVRWESSTPKISFEDSFPVEASALFTP